MKKIVFILAAALAALVFCLTAWQKHSAKSCTDNGIYAIQVAQQMPGVDDDGFIVSDAADFESEMTAGFLRDLWYHIKWWVRYNIGGWSLDGEIITISSDGDVLIEDIHVG